MKVIISATLRTFFDRNTEAEVKANTIEEILKELTERFPEAKKGLYDEDGNIRRFIRIFAGDEDVTDVSRHGEELDGTKHVMLLPFVAGGAPKEKLISDERAKAVSLDDKDIDRFNRHLLLREIGVKGQKRIRAAKVAVIGAGALGSPVIQYLAAAGVGTIKVIDHDTVALGNLQSQVIHSSKDVKRPKAASARDTIRNIDRNIEVIAENQQLTQENAAELIEGYDLVIDCTDNYRSRYLINDACILANIPLVFGAIYQYEGQVGILGYDDGPCLRCLYPEPPEPGLVPTCAEGGTISPLGGIIGSIQANEALKLIIGVGEHLSGKLLTVDAMNLHSGIVNVCKDERCPLCGRDPVITGIEDIDYEELCGLKKEEEAEASVVGLTPEELAERIENGEKITIVDVREPHERALIKFPYALVIPIGQLARRQKELDPQVDTIFICKEGKRSILAINTLREAGYKGPLYNLKGGMDAMKDIIFSYEGGGL
ncbi:MAG: molybdopterin-synthase adenylyltransferase MoeB [Lachnospiraceae bacterium]|nr:molybdopterin-synthase adenylyltransferase MoeB [Lachnospiraceae bacterium]